MSSLNLFSKFLSAEKIRHDFKLSPSLKEQLQFHQYFIRKQYNNPIEDNKSSINTTKELFHALSTLSKTELTELYLTKIEIIKNLNTNKLTILKESQPKQLEFYLKTNSSTIWKRVFLRIIPERLVFQIEKKDVKKVYSLCHYIPRKFKCTDYFSFVLEAVSDKVKDKYTTLYFGFTSSSICDLAFEEMIKGTKYGMTVKYALELNMKIPSQIMNIIEQQQSKSTTDSPSSPTRTLQESPSKSHKITPIKINNFNISKPNEQEENLIISQIIQQSILLTDLKELQDIQQPEAQGNINPHPTIVQQLLPNYKIQDIQSEQQMTTIVCQNGSRITQHNKNKKHFKMFITFGCKSELLFNALTNIDSIRQWNQQIQSVNIKNRIKSQNSVVMYMKMRNHSKTSRGRDFLYLRHSFYNANAVYIIDKSIQNLSYPPFMSIVRGQYSAVFGLIESKSKAQTLMVIDLKMNNLGMLNEEQNTHLTLKYLQSFQRINRYLSQNPTIPSNNLFNTKWAINRQSMNNRTNKQPQSITKFSKSHKLIDDQKQNSILKKVQINQSKSMKEIDIGQEIKYKNATKKLENMFSNQKSSQKIENKIDKEQSIQSIPIESTKLINQSINNKTINQQPEDLSALAKAKTSYWIPSLDKQGMSIMNWGCLKKKYKMEPWSRPKVIDQDFSQHHIWKGEWKHDDELGGLYYKDQQKMNAQKKVLGYVLKKMGSNLLSGKGITSISLPVDIFSTQSNLERLARTFCYAPNILQSVTKLDAITQMKSVVMVSLGHSLLYLSMQKPFNPVLGQTFQGSINGSPIYLQQTSHHPPIASFYFVGRGYKIYGSIQSKMNIGMNSGTGTNDGDFVVEFQNGNIVKFRTAGGQISGITFGDRKLNLVGKGYYWSPNNNLMLQVTYNPNKKGFFSVGKQETPSDFFSGIICKVSKQYIQKFQKQKNKPSMSKKDIIQQFSQVQGVWTKEIIIDGKVVFNVDKQKYLKFQYQPNSLPSDANYRQDVIYKRLGDIVRSQNQKQRIEDKQRKDRKLREKIHGKKH